MKNLHPHNVSIHINFYHNRFINECPRKSFVKILQRRTDVMSLLRCRRTYVLNNAIHYSFCSCQAQFYKFSSLTPLCFVACVLQYIQTRVSDPSHLNRRIQIFLIRMHLKMHQNSYCQSEKFITKLLIIGFRTYRETYVI